MAHGLTQDGRLALIQDNLLKARQGLHMASLLAQYARQLKPAERVEIETLLRQVSREVLRIAKYTGV